MTQAAQATRFVSTLVICLSAEQVKALQVGETITIRKEGHEPIICTVAFQGNPANKFLTYRDKGQIKRFAIRDYPGRSYKLSNYGGHDNEDKRRNQRPQD